MTVYTYMVDVEGVHSIPLHKHIYPFDMLWSWKYEAFKPGSVVHLTWTGSEDFDKFRPEYLANIFKVPKENIKINIVKRD